MYYHHQKIKRSKVFLKKFNKLYSDWELSRGYYEFDPYRPGKTPPFIFPSQTRMLKNINGSLLNTLNKEVLRIHYFSMKGYFEKFCTDPFEKALYKDLQDKKNSKYHSYLKFFYSKNEIQRRSIHDEDDLPF